MPTIKLLVDGGAMKPGPAVAQQLGPLGINMGKVISDVNEATKEFKGMQVPAVLEVDSKTKEFTVSVSTPSVSALIKKELGLELASGNRIKIQAGNIAFERVIAVTKQKQQGMLARDFLGALKSVIGSCMSLGLLIDSKDPKQVLQEIEEGNYKDEIENQKTEVSPEKEKELKDYFNKISSEQQAQKKAEEEAAAAAEAEKAAAATAKPAESAAAKPATAPAKK